MSFGYQIRSIYTKKNLQILANFVNVLMGKLNATQNHVKMTSIQLSLI